jgi:hypothetical protein
LLRKTKLEARRVGVEALLRETGNEKEDLRLPVIQPKQPRKLSETKPIYWKGFKGIHGFSWNWT